MGWAGKQNKSSLSFANPLLLPSASPVSCRACIAFVLRLMVSVVAELEHLKIDLVVNYWGKEGNSLSPQKVPRDTRGCPNTRANCHCFRETAETHAWEWPRLASRMQWTEMYPSEIVERSDCCGPSVQAQGMMLRRPCQDSGSWQGYQVQSGILKRAS